MNGEPGLFLRCGLPPDFFTADLRDVGQEIALVPPEEIFVAAAGARRRREFAMGRHCAHLALRHLGTDAEVIPAGANGAPVWPAGIKGSITHTIGYAAAAVARSEDCFALGIDAERVDRFTGQVMRKLFDLEEHAVLEKLDDAERPRIATLMFSAKEAWYKAFNPAGVTFTDLHVEAGATISVANRKSGEAAAGGTYAFDGDLVVTAIWRAA